MAEKQHVFLVGAKSLGAYGGYETFIDKLTEYHQDNKNIQYHVAVKANGQGHMDETKVDAKIISGSRFIYHNADCFKIHVPEKLGPAQAIYYDCKALDKCVEIIKEEGIKHPIVYIMACRIGPFMKKYYKAIHRLDGKVYLNPDGHEWMRAKWSDPVRKYWKVSEQMMVKYSDLAVCDSVNIEKYIHEQYDGKGIRGRNPKTTFIAYGAETRKSLLADDDKKLLSWYEQKGLKPKAYYLVVGRFVPENNYETNRIILSVGNLQPRKNLPRLMRAFVKLKKDSHFSDVQLVVVGKKAWMFDDIMKESADNNKDIILTDYVSNEDLVRLYNLADGFVYPSFYEGFGIPPLEAMACGTPVAVANATSLPEVVGDAGMYFDPFSEEEITNSIVKLLDEDKAIRDEKRIERVNCFNWQDSANAMFSKYIEVVGNN